MPEDLSGIKGSKDFVLNGHAWMYLRVNKDQGGEDLVLGLKAERAVDWYIK